MSVLRAPQVLTLLLLVAVGTPVLAQPTGAVRDSSAGAEPLHVIITTELGEIEATLDSARAPVTVTNFLRYVDGGRYSNGRFHRTVTRNNQPSDSVRIEVIQGGTSSPPSQPAFAPIAIERTGTTGLRHRDGALSMARGGPNTATSDFFIVIGDQPSLDEGGHRNLDGQGFAAFGQVVKGMAVVRAIQASAHTAQALSPPVRIVGIRRGVSVP